MVTWTSHDSHMDGLARKGTLANLQFISADKPSHRTRGYLHRLQLEESVLARRRGRGINLDKVGSKHLVVGVGGLAEEGTIDVPLHGRVVEQVNTTVLVPVEAHGFVEQPMGHHLLTTPLTVQVCNGNDHC